MTVESLELSFDRKAKAKYAANAGLKSKDRVLSMLTF